MAVQWTIWWMNWGTRSGTGDDTVGVVGDAWRRQGPCTGYSVVRLAVLGTTWWKYWETRGGIGERYGESIGGHLVVPGCPRDPLNNSGGVLGHPPAP